MFGSESLSYSSATDVETVERGEGVVLEKHVEDSNQRGGVGGGWRLNL